MKDKEVIKYLENRLAELDTRKPPNYNEDIAAAYELVIYDLKEG